MWKITATGTVIPVGIAWVHPVTGNKFPANWIQLSTIDDRAAVGMVWEDDPPPPEPEPLPLETQKEIKIAQFEAHTKVIFARGVPAHVGGVEYSFDTRTGERAAANWQILDSVIARCLINPALEPALFPRNISTINDEYVLELDTAANANNFWIELMTNDASIAAEGATLRRQVREATTQEELDAVVDTRP